MGRVVKKTNEDGSTLTYTYDQNGNVIAQTDENGFTTRYTYNKNNQPLTVTDPMGGVTTYTYSPSTVISAQTNALWIYTKKVDKCGKIVGKRKNGKGITDVHKKQARQVHRRV